MWLLSLLLAFQNAVIPGDHPDPSVIRVGAEYWAASTTSAWAPIFPLLRSADLKTWRTRSAVFHQRPAWAINSFWAPELTIDRGHIRVYYAARNMNGPLCVAVATAEKAAGPYTDHGPMICQEDGSIDPFFVRDEKGKPFLIWKEDGNSRNQPSIIFAQPTTEDGLQLIGAPREIIRNDAAWEGKVVEGPDVLRHDGWFYLLYAGGACCGRACNYGEGVARAKSLLGPWEKNPANPIITANKYWTCPGHGTTVKGADGADYFLFHAYSRGGFVQTGREALLARVMWRNGWPVMMPGEVAPHAPSGFHENFIAETALDPGWQWPLDDEPKARIAAGLLTLTPPPARSNDFLAAILGRPLAAVDFQIETALSPTDAAAGLTLLGDRQHAIGLAVKTGEVFQWRIDPSGWSKLSGASIPSLKEIHLRVRCQGGTRIESWYRVGAGAWQSLPAVAQPDSLAPWDQGLRGGIFSSGPATFKNFNLTYSEKDR